MGQDSKDCIISHCNSRNKNAIFHLLIIKIEHIFVLVIISWMQFVNDSLSEDV